MQMYIYLLVMDCVSSVMIGSSNRSSLTEAGLKSGKSYVNEGTKWFENLN